MNQELKNKCFASLNALYVAVDEVIAIDLNEKVRAYISDLEKKLEEEKKYANRYHALESAGVDNWSGYEYAQEEWAELEDEDDE